MILFMLACERGGRSLWRRSVCWPMKEVEGLYGEGLYMYVGLWKSGVQLQLDLFQLRGKCRGETAWSSKRICAWVHACVRVKTWRDREKDRENE